MTEYTSDSILARLDKFSAAQTSAVALPETTETPLSVTQTTPGSAPNATLRSDPQPDSELRRSSRSHTRSKRATEGGYDTELAADKQRAERTSRTRSRRGKSKSSRYRSDIESSTYASETDNDRRDLSPSPSPIATANEPEAQITCVHLEDKLACKFQAILDSSGMQTLGEVYEAISSDPAHPIQPEEYRAEARFQSPIPLEVGGGFHLDHFTHRSGNSRTYRGRRGSLPRVPTPETELEDDQGDYQPLAIQFISSQEQVPIHSTLPAPNPTASFLGYPEQQDFRCSHSLVADRPIVSPSPSDRSPTSSPGHEGGTHPPMRSERSITHISTSSKSLGDPPALPRPASSHGGGAVFAFNEARSASQRSRLSGILQPRHGSTPEPTVLRLTPSEPEVRSQSNLPRLGAKRPLETLETPLPPRKRPTTALRSTAGGKSYNGRLNIVEIDQERVTTTGVPSRQASRRRSAPSQTRKAAKSTAGASDCSASIPPPTGNDDFDLLDGIEEDSAITDMLVKMGYRKPTVHDLPGYERALWKPVCDLTWAFSMGQGNFQTRGKFISWTEACFSETIEERLPHMDPANTTMSDEMRTVIVNSMSNRRHRDYLRLRPPMQGHFELNNPSTSEDRKRNEARVSQLFPSWFHYKDLNKRVDPYEGRALAIGLESMFFYGPEAIGAQYLSLFQRSNKGKNKRNHLAILAYVATMIQFYLGEWEKGYFIKGKLNATKLHCVWLCHFDGLKNVNAVAHKRLDETYDRWVQDAYDASQAHKKFSRKSYVQAVIRTQDVRPDTPPPDAPAPSNQD